MKTETPLSVDNSGPYVSIVTVTYNSESVIRAFLDSLNRMMEKLGLFVETIITDNASKDATAEILRDSHRYSNLHVSLVLNQRNVGLSKALNEMLRLCRGKRILICNPDIAFTESIREMLKISEHHPELVLVPELLDADGTPQRLIYRRFPTILRVISDFTVMGRSVPKLLNRIRDDYRYVGRRFRSPIDNLEQTSAVCMLVSRKVVDMVSPFYDPAFPVYWNDVDMSKRAEVLGVQRVIVPATKIIHGLGQSSKGARPEKIAMLFYSAHGMIGYARRWNMYPNLIRLILFCDTIFWIQREVVMRMIGRKTRELARMRALGPFAEMARTHLLPFRCSLR
ncbi:MAG TPA: glycosyltransferase [Candidatus Bathyarchaeia archaeon]|nr:glycosyltransferase [Candidatus Bathyarchaeia archaeon]